MCLLVYIKSAMEVWKRFWRWGGNARPQRLRLNLYFIHHSNFCKLLVLYILYYLFSFKKYKKKVNSMWWCVYWLHAYVDYMTVYSNTWCVYTRTVNNTLCVYRTLLIWPLSVLMEKSDWKNQLPLKGWAGELRPCWSQCIPHLTTWRGTLCRRRTDWTC